MTCLQHAFLTQSQYGSVSSGSLCDFLAGESEILVIVGG